MIKGLRVSPVLDSIKMEIPGESLPTLSKILKAFGEEKINIWFGVQIKNRDDFIKITFGFDSSQVERALTIIREHYPGLDFSLIKSVNIISAFPFRENPEIAFQFVKALEDKSVPILGLSTSLSSVSCLIPQEDCEQVKKSMEEAFGFRPGLKNL